MALLLVLTGIAVAVAAALFLRRRRRRRPLTRAEKLATARSAARGIRKSSGLPASDIFYAGDGVPDRHSGPIAENATYGDAGNFGSGGGYN